MTDEQANEIRAHLIDELNRNGFSDVVLEINTRLEEDYEEKGFEGDSHFLLDYYLSESIDVFQMISNKNYDNLLNRFNEYITGKEKIENITVELLNQGEPISYNLKNLPNYEPVISTLKEIRNQLNNEI